MIAFSMYRLLEELELVLELVLELELALELVLVQRSLLQRVILRVMKSDRYHQLV